ncbi:hypothetical protein Q9K02_03035 [Qipengyuania sp. G39]|uniref:Uncharacterized protein n=1 Tax=Qipengyuania profundimaris TaxID=3067652 RepID=A0ABT9HLU1_9SPHN|nr:hypothetical protein [Qipengyuania sp. G39]MDP4574114.1 hypothetical protein [Qipengyuania sp. G39]
MPLKKTTAFARIGREMSATEQAVADAIVAASALMHSAALAHRDVGEGSPVEVQKTFMRLLKLNGGLIEAQGEALRVHDQLMDIARETGATEQPTCPEKEIIYTGEADLRVA